MSRSGRRGAISRPADHRRTTSVLAKLLLVSFGLLAALVIGEVAVRVFDFAPDTNVVYKENYRLSRNPVLQYELVPRSRGGRLRISAEGLRDKEYPLEKPSGVFRILMIGDSIAYGFGVEQDEPVSEQLEALLQAQPPASEPPIEVLNLGVTGYNIEQVAENLRVRGLRFAPDLVLYSYCLNDPQDYSFELESLKAQLSGAQLSYRENLLRGSRRLAEKSRLFLLLRYALHVGRAPERPAAAPQDKQWLAFADGTYPEYFASLYEKVPERERLRRGAEALRRIAQEAGVPLVAVVFPVFIDLQQYRLEQLHREVVRLFEEHGIPVYYLLPLYIRMLRSHGPVFVFNALHPNPVGHRLAALYLLKQLIEDGHIPRQDAPAAALLRTPQDRALASVVAEAGARPAMPSPAQETPGPRSPAPGKPQQP